MNVLKASVFLILLLTQNASAQFVEQTSIVLPGLFAGSIQWGDYDNDSDLDILLSGSADPVRITKVYRNNGDNTFTEQTSISLTPVYDGNAAWGDYDNDNDLDILLTGEAETGYISKIYKNNGDNSFSEQIGVTLTGVTGSSAAWGDYDNDGDLDIILAGRYTTLPITYPVATKIYENTGSGFVESFNLTGIMSGSVEWGDYDNDSDLDILLTGDMGGSMNYTAKIFKNNGNSTFTEQAVSLPHIMMGSAVWGDYDNDGDLDILLSGFEGPGNVTKVFRNEGSDIFTEQASIVLLQIGSGSAEWGDYDNDGNLDILLTGSTELAGGVYYSKIYRNNGNNTFTDQTQILLTAVFAGAAEWGDYDNDNDLDIILYGITPAGLVTKIYRNMITAANTLPTVPLNLSAHIYDDNTINLQWNKSTDLETPQNGLKYNLSLGCEPGGTEIYSPMSDTSTGYRRIVDMGNTNHRNVWMLKGFSDRRYYWKVQAVDNNFAGSDFSIEKGFAIVTITLTNGWNLVSIPGINPNGQSPSIWFPGRDPAAGVFGYNNGYYLVNTLEPGKAYWIKHIGTYTYRILLEIVPPAPIPIHQGWNLFGVYDYEVSSNELTSSPPGLIMGSVYGYTGGYLAVSTLYPGKGYWVKLTGTGFLNIPGYNGAGCISGWK